MSLNDKTRMKKVYSFFKEREKPILHPSNGSSLEMGSEYGQIVQWDNSDYDPTLNPIFPSNVIISGSLTCQNSASFKTITIAVSGNVNLLSGSSFKSENITINSSSISFSDSEFNPRISGDGNILAFYDENYPNGIALSGLRPDFQNNIANSKGYSSVAWSETGVRNCKKVFECSPYKSYGSGISYSQFVYLGEGQVICACNYSNRHELQLYKSYDYGETWTAKVTLRGIDDVALQVYPTRTLSYIGNGVILAYSSYVKYKSYDYGETWTISTSDLGTNRYFSNVIRGSGNDLYCYQAVNSSLVYKSTNNGSTWSSVAVINGYKDFYDMQYIGSNTLILGGSVYAAYSTNYNNFFKSIDGAQTWLSGTINFFRKTNPQEQGHVTSFMYFGNGLIFSACRSPYGGTGCYAAKSYNSGSTWRNYYDTNQRNQFLSYQCYQTMYFGGGCGLYCKESPSGNTDNLFFTFDGAESFLNYGKLNDYIPGAFGPGSYGTSKQMRNLDDHSILLSVYSLTQGLVIKSPGMYPKHITRKQRCRKVSTITGSYNVTELNEIIAITNSTGLINVVIPESCSIGRTFEIKDMTGNASVNNINVTSSYGVLFNNSSNQLINTDYGLLKITHIQSGSWAVL